MTEVTYQRRRVTDPPLDVALPIGLATIRIRGKDMHRALLRGDGNPTTVSGPIEILNYSRRPPSTKVIHMPRGALLQMSEHRGPHNRGRSTHRYGKGLLFVIEFLRLTSYKT